jgi:hypothetical protein
LQICSACFVCSFDPSPSACSEDWPCQHVDRQTRGIQFLSCAMFPSPSTCSGAWPCQSKGRRTCGVLPSPLSCHQLSPSTCSGAWLKPIYGS